MIPFEFTLPTRIVFGVGEFQQLGELAVTLGTRVFLVTGKRAMKELGILDRAVEMLNQTGLQVAVYDRIESNPLVSTVDMGGAKAREIGADLVIGMGGGSAMDAAKGIALIAKNPGSIWDYAGKVNMVETLPVMAVLTLAATGSEANRGGVVTHDESRQKGPFFAPAAQPKISIIDPELTRTVPLNLTMDGVADILSHVLETYFTGVTDTPLQDRLTEGIVLATMEAGEQLYRDPQNVTARANLCWCSTVALCGLIQSGRGGSWALHGMEHALSGHYDISHGRGLAILFPRLMAHCLKEQSAKYAQFARRVFHVNDPDDQSAARQGLKLFIEWLAGIGLYQTLSDVGIGDDKFDQMADDTLALYGDPSGYIDAQHLIDRQGIIDIYRASLK